MSMVPERSTSIFTAALVVIVYIGAAPTHILINSDPQLDIKTRGINTKRRSYPRSLSKDRL